MLTVFWCFFSFFMSSVYSGPADPIHGTALYQKVRNTAQVGYRLWLFSLKHTRVAHY